MKLITQVNKMDEDWKNVIKKNWWATNYDKDIENILDEGKRKNKDIEKLLILRDRLINIGGEECCLPFGDEDIDNILNKGELFIPEPINNEQEKYLVEYYEEIGEQSRCHDNSAELFWNNRNNKKIDCDIRICTGYALSDDGMWRHHSWIVALNDNEIISIIETTEKRVAYYGYTFTEEECLDFCSWYEWLI